MKKRVAALALLLALSISTIAGCSNQANNAEPNNDKEVVNELEKNMLEEYGVQIGEDSVTFTDSRNQQVTLNKHPERVVVLFNSYLEIWAKSGGTIVGRIEESEDKIVEGTENAEIVGTLGAISLEKVLSLKPDLVILNGNSKIQMEIVPILEDNGIGVVALDFFVKDDYFKLVRLFTALNEREDLYQANALQVKENIEKIIEKSPKDKSYKVLIMMASAKSITARGSDAYLGEMLKDLHTANIADTSNNTLDDKNFSLEKIIEEDPDFIFVQTTGSDMEAVLDRIKKDVESNPAWASLKAVKEGRYILLPKDLYMYKANHRYAEAYEGLAKHLYTDLFE
ncbi:ABC transporter substrate-binding protein [Alkaliphilus sp. B6464]|uniref:ABC transporter substrate-binding protein n=1 Tax=Alkaliphilus sp. B6464 TaxID=2731219 RepID=UPI001BAC0A57|nr:ABC transporter substrate-binding protein [Alkaliphilus sp. B6464]QUH21302.1 ABC transporter substrate-binding protein [Alkaliphilus sp. B6464]